MKLFNALFIVVCSLLPLQGYTHPHSFVDLKNNIQVEGSILRSFQMEWMLDEIASSELIYEIKNSTDQEKTKHNITAEMVQSAIQNHYFSKLYDSNNQPIKFTAKPTNTYFEIKQNRIIFYITVNVSGHYDLKNNPARLTTYEPSYYMAMEYSQPNDVSINNSACKVELIQPQVDSKLRLYASKLDKNQSPEMSDNEDYSLGAHFAQKVEMLCE